MISTFDVQEGDDTGIELDDANIITDQFHQKVEKGQIYKDKNLLALVMKQYAVREKCQYRVHKSCPRRSVCMFSSKKLCDTYIVYKYANILCEYGIVLVCLCFLSVILV